MVRSDFGQVSGHAPAVLRDEAPQYRPLKIVFVERGAPWLEGKRPAYRVLTMPTVERTKLYQDVGARPCTRIAAELGIPNNALKRICSGVDIPTPVAPTAPAFQNLPSANPDRRALRHDDSRGWNWHGAADCVRPCGVRFAIWGNHSSLPLSNPGKSGSMSDHSFRP